MLLDIVPMTLDEMEAFIARHGIVAFLDHLGLDGAGNTVNDLYAIAGAANTFIFKSAISVAAGTTSIYGPADEYEQLIDAIARTKLPERPSA